MADPEIPPTTKPKTPQAEHPLTPPWMSRILEEYVAQTYFARSKRFGHLDYYFPVVYQLHEWFLRMHHSRENRTVPSGYLQLPPYRVAYLLYFGPLNAIRFLGMCRLLFERPGSFEILNDVLARRPLRIMDVGSGPGSAVWGWFYFLAEAYPHLLRSLELEIHLVDQSGKILQDAETLLGAFRPEVASLRVFRRRFDFQSGLPHERFDLVFLPYCLNELPSESSRWRLVSELVYRNLARGLLLAIEPATSIHAKRLTALRDRVLDEGLPVRIVSPCLHSGRCPLASPGRKDFCHFTTRYHPNLGPTYIQIKRYLCSRDRMGFDISEEKLLSFSYVVFTNHEAAHRLPKPASKLLISDSLAETPKGKKYMVCVPDRPAFIYSHQDLHRGLLV